MHDSTHCFKIKEAKRRNIKQFEQRYSMRFKGSKVD